MRQLQQQHHGLGGNSMQNGAGRGGGDGYGQHQMGAFDDPLMTALR